MTWQVVGRCVEGEPFKIGGVNVWQHRWRPLSREAVHVLDPVYRDTYKVWPCRWERSARSLRCRGVLRFRLDVLRRSVMMAVDPRSLDQAFAAFLREAGVRLDTSPDTCLRALIDFYASIRADGCEPDADQDMLLFQWGTYDWGDGEHFEIDLVRQVIVPDEADDDAIWQLHLTYRYLAAERQYRWADG